MLQILALSSFKDYLEMILSYIPKFMYFITASLLGVVDLFQYVLRKLAGLDTYYVDGNQQTGDIVISFIKSIFTEDSQYPALKNVFWSLVIFGLILLVIATIVAIIRQEYMPSSEDLKEKPSNNKYTIIARSFKSLFLFLIVPVSCLFGLFLSDVILVSLDNITSTQYTSALFEEYSADNILEKSTTTSGKTTYINYDMFGARNAATTSTFSGYIFKAAAYNCNRVRINDSYGDTTYYEMLSNNQISNFGLFNQPTTQQGCAQIIDDAFAACAKLKTAQPVNTDNVSGDIVGIGFAFTLSGNEEISCFSKFNVGLVYYYYDLWTFNFLIAFAVLILELKLFVNIIFGLIKRIIEMIALFMVSPPIVAIMPLDGGKAFAEWRKNFISRALSAYGAIIGMNIMFLLLGYLNEIQLFDPSQVGMDVLNLIMNTLFMVVGLIMVQGFISLLGNLIDSEDVAKSGADLAAKTGDTLARSAKMTGALAGAAVKTAAFAPKMALKGANALANKSEKVRNFKAGVKSTMKNLGTGAKNLPGRLFTHKKRKQSETNIQDEWNNRGGAEKAYEEYLGNNKDYNSSIDTAFNARSNKFASMDRDTWLKQTPEGIQAAKNAQAAAIAAGANDLTTFKNVSLPNSAGAAVLNAQIKASSQQISREATQKINRGILKATGMSNITSLSSMYFDTIKGASIQGGKGGFTSMMKAFQGLSAKEIEEQELIKKYSKEESAKMQVQENVRKKMEKNKK